MSDKKISELPIATAISTSDISVLVDSGTDYQYTFTLLLQFLEANLITGAKISFGTVLPQNTTGSNGDVFVNTSAGLFAQKISGTWTVVYTLPAANGADGTLLYGAGLPATSTGKNSDSYINTLTGIFYQKIAGVWSQVFSMATGPQGPQGIAGTNGTNGADGNTILFGVADPSNSITGANGNFYINTTTYKLFGPKTSGVWGSGVSLVGAGVPGGGAPGQILAKADGADFNTIWEDNSFANISGQPTDNSNMVAALNGKVDKVTGFGLSSNDYTSTDKARLASLTNHYQGKYSTLAALQTAIPTGTDGDYAIVTGSPNDQEYIWDSDHTTWVVTENIPASTFAALGGNATDNASLSAALSAKEDIAYKDSINGYAGLDGSGNFNKTTDNLPEGSTDLYFTANRVLATILAGISFLAATAVLATDTILQAVGKLQAQITALLKIPTGGASGQVLTKVDAADGNTQWTNVLAASNNLADLGDVNAAQQNLGVPQVFNIVRANGNANGAYTEFGTLQLSPTLDPNGWHLDEVHLRIIMTSDNAYVITVPYNPAMMIFDFVGDFWFSNGSWVTMVPSFVNGLNSQYLGGDTYLQALYVNAGDGNGYVKLRMIMLGIHSGTQIAWNIAIYTIRPTNLTFTPLTGTGTDTTAYLPAKGNAITLNYKNGVIEFFKQPNFYNIPLTLFGATSGNTPLKAAAVSASGNIVVLPGSLPLSSGQNVQSDTSGNWSYSNTSVSVANGDFTAQTANKTIATFTTGGLTAFFRIGGYININSVTTDIIQLQVAYTDENNVSRTGVFYNLGATTSGLSAAGNSNYPTIDIRCKNGTIITVSAILTTTGGSINYDCGARIQQI